jgi:hypothetical protein
VPILLAVLAASLIWSAGQAFATSGDYYNGGVAGGTYRCAPSGDCSNADLKTRNTQAWWYPGVQAWTGLQSPSLGWVGLARNTNGYGYVSTWSTVHAECGSDNAFTWMECWTDNL